MVGEIFDGGGPSFFLHVIWKAKIGLVWFERDLARLSARLVPVGLDPSHPIPN